MTTGLKEFATISKSAPLHDYIMLINARLPDIIAKHGRKKPLMVFCITRKSAQSTAKYLANAWASKDPKDRQWQGPTLKIAVSDPELISEYTSIVRNLFTVLTYERHAYSCGCIPSCWS